jgi:hypothetical protein
MTWLCHIYVALSSGVAFNFILELGGDPGDWRAAGSKGKIWAGQYPNDPLMLMLHGGILMRQGRV